MDMRFADLGEKRTINDVDLENVTNEGYLQMPHTSLTVQNINGIPFNDFVQKLIFKGAEDIVLSGKTTIEGVGNKFIEYYLFI